MNLPSKHHKCRGHQTDHECIATMGTGSKAGNFPAGVKQEVDVFLRSSLNIGRNTLMLTTVPVNKQIKNGTDIVLPHFQITEYIALARVVTRVDSNSIKINIVNMSNEPQTLEPGTKLCTAKYLEHSEVINKATLANLSNEPAEEASNFD